jgi:S-adenosylmethionine decarboxylase
MPKQVGTHCIAELYQCPPTLLDDVQFISKAIREAARRAKSELLHEVTHKFEPVGVTALALLAESHLSIHTWPEDGYAAVDAFTCGDKAQPEAACRYLARVLKAGRVTMSRTKRGLATHKLESFDMRARIEPAPALSDAEAASPIPEQEFAESEEEECREPSFAQISG